MLSRLQRSWPPSRDCTRADHTAWLCSAIAKLIRSTRAPIEHRLIGKIMGGNRLLCGTRVPVAGNRVACLAVACLDGRQRRSMRLLPGELLPFYARLPAASPRHRPPAMKRIFAPSRCRRRRPATALPLYARLPMDDPRILWRRMMRLLPEAALEEVLPTLRLDQGGIDARVCSVISNRTYRDDRPSTFAGCTCRAAEPGKCYKALGQGQEAAMRAVWYDRQGAADEVLVCGELPTPEVGQGEVRVRLEASGVNPSDTYRRRGPPAMEYPRVVTNSDGAGVIDQVGRGVPERWLGKRVWLYNGQRNGRWQGTAAEYIALSVDLVTELPDHVSFAEGATLGVPGMTAHRSVFVAGPVQGKTLLVKPRRGVHAHGSFFTLSKRKGLLHLSRLKTVRSTISPSTSLAPVPHASRNSASTKERQY
jgi:hypothetical protein